MDEAKIKKLFKEALQEQLNEELNDRETFSPDIRKQIIETYQRLWKEKLEWLEQKEKEKELS